MTEQVGTGRSPHERLVDAGLELFGTIGYDASTIQALCREARVSTRDFYRLVGDRIGLFQRVFDREVERVLGPVAAALDEVPAVWRVRAALWVEHWVGTMLEDPRRFRVLYREAIGVSAALDRRRGELLRASTDLAMEQLALCAEPGGEDRPDRYYEVPAVAILAAARELMLQFMAGTLSLDTRDAVAEALVRLCLVIGEKW